MLKNVKWMGKPLWNLKILNKKENKKKDNNKAAANLK